jgi:hypothetical protein
MCTPRFWQPARENPSLGKPTKGRVLLELQEVHKLHQIYMAASEHLQTPKLSHRNLPRKPCPEIRTAVRPAPNQHLEFHANLLLYGLLCTAVLQQQIPSSCLDFCASLASKNMPTSLAVWTVRIHTVRPPSQQYISATSKQNFLPWDLCPISLENRAKSAAHNFFQALSQISLACLAHYPRLSLL